MSVEPMSAQCGDAAPGGVTAFLYEGRALAG